MCGYDYAKLLKTEAATGVFTRWNREFARRAKKIWKKLWKFCKRAVIIDYWRKYGTRRA
jgi:hypothetical protein